MLASLIVAAIALIGVAPAPTEAAAGHRHYGESAREVAREIGCVNFRRTGGGALNRDAGVCWLRGKRVNVITFRGPGQQRSWNSVASFSLPSNHYWANGKGALVTARNGNRPAAVVGARLLPGLVRHGA